jgi:hypothetical protein
MAGVRAHPANTPRTRLWWGRFLVLLWLETVSQVCTNVEQLFPSGSVANGALNITEHLFATATGAMAVFIAYHALMEAYARRASEEGEGS